MKTQTLWHGVIKHADGGSRKKSIEVRVRMDLDKPVYVEHWERENPGLNKWAHAGIEISLETLKTAFLERHLLLHRTANTITDSLNGVE